MAGLHDLDRRLSEIISGIPARFSPFMDGLTFLGEPVVVLAVGSAALISAVARGQSSVQLSFILGGVAFGVGTLLKLVLKRRRPHGRVIRNFGINSYSFPSGHAFGTVIFYGLLAITDDKTLATAWRAVLTSVIVLLIFLVGISRVFKGAHYPSDVLAGWLLGIISLIVVYAIVY